MQTQKFQLWLGGVFALLIIGAAGIAAAQITPQEVPVEPSAPVYQAPPPVYQTPPPVYQAPPPVYQAPAPVYQAPPPPVYQAPAPVYQAPPVQPPPSTTAAQPSTPPAPASTSAAPPAAEANPFDELQTLAADAFRQGRTLIYVVGGIAALGLAVLAFFGKVRWVWFFSLIAGIACVAIMDIIFNYLTIEGPPAGEQLKAE
ncbi:MAG: hypothetical protein AB7G80_06380 [Dongiaceae bacterium]